VVAAKARHGAACKLILYGKWEQSQYPHLLIPDTPQVVSDVQQMKTNKEVLQEENPCLIWIISHHF